MKEEIRKKMRDALNACIYDQNVQLEDIKKILETTREMYDLDMVFVVTNREYKYQMDHLITCSRTGTTLKTYDHLMLTTEQYDKIVRDYQKEQVSTKPIEAIQKDYVGSVLHCAIMRNGVHYGTIGFRDNRKRVWSEEEKNEIKVLSQLMLIYIGFEYLNKGEDQHDIRKKMLIKANTVNCFSLNLNTGKCHSICMSPNLKDKINEWDDYSKIQDIYTHYFMDPIYGQKMRENFDLNTIKKRLGTETSVMSIEYPRILGDTASWFRYTVNLINISSDGTPGYAVGTIDDITEETQKNAYFANVSEVNQKSYAIIAGIDLDTEQYSVFVDNRNADCVDYRIGAIGGYRDLMKSMIADSIDSDYANRFMELFSIENMKKSFDAGTDRLGYDFPYTLNGKVTFWVRLEAVPSHGFSENNRRIMLYYSDITEQKNKESQLEEIKEVLEQEHEQIHQTKLQLMLDPLTGAYNRKGFEEVIKSHQEKNESIVFMIIDVDDFKSINDTYGHEFGDETLKLVVEQLKTVFRKEDKVFRLGGDEFALLMCECGPDAWDSIQLKFSSIHRNLRKAVKKEIPVTLSAGFCLSNNGYSKELYALADEALYYTKRNGRAGLTHMDDNHNVCHYWNDSIASADKKRQIEQSGIGNWRIEYTDSEANTPRLFLDEAAHTLLEIPDGLSPEECFKRWYENVSPKYLDALIEMRDKISATGQSECTYFWKHPTEGEILLRSGGRMVDDGETKEIYGYHQSLKNTSIVPNIDDGQLLMQSMNSIYFCSYYINLSDGAYYTFKGNMMTEGLDIHTEDVSDTLQDFINQYVHPDFHQVMRDFVDLKTLSQRLKHEKYIDCEYLSLTEKGWCRSRFMPVKWDRQGNLTHALYVIYSIDASKKKELEKDRATKETLQGLLKTEYKLMACVQTMISMKDSNEALEYLLNQIVDYYDCDRLCLARLSEKDKGVIISEHCNKGIKSRFNKGQEFPLTKHMQWEQVYSPIKIGKAYFEGKDDPDFEWMKEFGVDNLLMISFEYNNRDIGYISIDNIKKHRDADEWIETLAFFISYEMGKIMQSTLS